MSAMSPVHRDQFACSVVANIPLCREHYRLVLGLPQFPPTDPGHFIQLSCRDLGQDFNPTAEFDWQPGQRLTLEGTEIAGPLAVLRRPFSLAGRRDVAGGVELDVIHRVVGIGTSWLSHLKTGDRAFILGPLGNRFSLPADGGPAILIGGGVGIPPMLYLAERLADRPAVAFCGALGRDLLPLTIQSDIRAPGSESAEPLLNIDEFARHQIPSVITTDDGSYGFRGFVTQALEQYLDRTKFPVAPTLYTCGPEPMMKRVAQIAAARGLVCQIAVERAMACGMGTCQSCCIRVKKPVDIPPLVGKDWCYRLACTDGPVFLGSELLW